MPNYRKTVPVTAARYPDKSPGEIVGEFAEAHRGTRFGVLVSVRPGIKDYTIAAGRNTVSFQSTDELWVVYDGEVIVSVSDQDLLNNYTPV